jgi:hypothetical protein
MNARNAETLQRELMKRNLAWTAENLQIVWNEIDRYLIDDSEDKRPEAKPFVPSLWMRKRLCLNSRGAFVWRATRVKLASWR